MSDQIFFCEKKLKKHSLSSVFPNLWHLFDSFGLRDCIHRSERCNPGTFQNHGRPPRPPHNTPIKMVCKPCGKINYLIYVVVLSHVTYCDAMILLHYYIFYRCRYLLYYIYVHIMYLGTIQSQVQSINLERYMLHDNMRFWRKICLGRFIDSFGQDSFRKVLLTRSVFEWNKIHHISLENTIGGILVHGGLCRRIARQEVQSDSVTRERERANPKFLPLNPFQSFFCRASILPNGTCKSPTFSSSFLKYVHDSRK